MAGRGRHQRALDGRRAAGPAQLPGQGHLAGCRADDDQLSGYALEVDGADPAGGDVDAPYRAALTGRPGRHPRCPAASRGQDGGSGSAGHDGGHRRREAPRPPAVRPCRRSARSGRGSARRAGACRQCGSGDLRVAIVTRVAVRHRGGAPLPAGTRSSRAARRAVADRLGGQFGRARGAGVLVLAEANVELPAPRARPRQAESLQAVNIADPGAGRAAPQEEPAPAAGALPAALPGIGFTR